MRLEVKALQMSLIVHALLLLLLIIFSKNTLNAQKVVVIDLTLIDQVTADEGSSGNKKANEQKLVPREVSPVIVQKREEVMSLGAKGVVTDIHYMREVKKRLDAKTSTENIIKDYVKQASKSLTRHLQKDKLVALGESLLQEARSL